MNYFNNIISRTSAIPSALQSTNLSQFSMVRPTRDKLINMARDTGAKCQMRTSRSSSRKFVERRKSTVNTTINPLPDMIHKQMSKINLTNESQKQPTRMSRLAKSASVHNHPQLSSAICTYGDNKKAAVTNINRARSISSSSSHSFNDDDDDDDQDDNEKAQTTFTAFKKKSESKAKNGAEKYVSIVRSSSTKNKKDSAQTSTFSQIKQTTKNPNNNNNNNNKGTKDTHHQIPSTDSLESSSLQSVDITHFSATKYTAHSKDGSTKNFYHTSKSTQRNSRSSSTCKTTVLTAVSTCKTARSSSQTKNYTAISMYSRNNNNNNYNNNDD
jgi:hypothetical protein